MDDILKTFLFGATLAISVGPIALLTMVNGIRYGASSASRSALGAASGDFIFAFFSFGIGGALMSTLNQYQSLLNSGSSIILIFFGLYMLFCATRTTQLDVGYSKNRAGFWQTLILTLSNPLTIIAFVAFAGQINNPNSLLQYLLLALALFAGSLIVQLVYAVFGSKLHGLSQNLWFTRSMQAFSGVAIASLGASGFLN